MATNNKKTTNKTSDKKTVKKTASKASVSTKPSATKNATKVEIEIRAWEKNSAGDYAYTAVKKLTVSDIEKSNWLQGRIEIPSFSNTEDLEHWIIALNNIVDSMYNFSNKVLTGPEQNKESLKTLNCISGAKTFSFSNSKDVTALKKLLKGNGDTDPVSFGTHHNGMIIPFAYYFLHFGDMGELSDYLEFDFPDGFSNDEERVSEEDGLELWEAVESGWEFVRSSSKQKTKPTASPASNDSGTVKIGEQIWMIRNLDVEQFRNGDRIPEVKSDEEWDKAGKEGKPAWCHFRNKADNGKKYGKLYNFHAVSDPRGLAPKGWQVPTEAEWDSLVSQYGSEDEAGDALKSAADFPKGTGDNRSGFAALPGADRLYYGPWGNDGYANFWTSSGKDSQAIYINICPSDGYVTKMEYPKGSGFSVRCIKDLDKR